MANSLCQHVGIYSARPELGSATQVQHAWGQSHWDQVAALTYHLQGS